MTATVSLSVATPVRFLGGDRFSLAGSTRSGRKLAIAGRNPCKAVAVQAFAETAPVALKTRKQDSLYEVLGVNRNASLMEIKAAYRSLAKMYHPDACLHPESPSSPDGRDFIEIHNAYATLSDPEARALYDLSLTAGSRPRPFGYAASAAGNSSGFYRTRRWETDQCW